MRILNSLKVCSVSAEQGGMEKSIYILSLLLVSTGLLLSGCSSDAEIRATTGVSGVGGGGSTSGGTTGGSTGGGSGATCSDALCLQVNIVIPGTGAITNIANCETSGIGTACVATVPERDLFFNNVEIVNQTGDAETCEYLSFRYYSYRRSNNPMYAPPSDRSTQIDCSSPGGPSDPKECVGGSWPESEVFPNFNGVHQNTAVSNLLTITLPSAASFSPGNPIGNRYASNDLDILSQPVDGVDYLGGSLVDYQLSCLDEFNETLASIILVIDEDNGPLSQIDGWD